MKAARLHAYRKALKLDEIDEPKLQGPLDVIVRIGAAGLCRTDLHIQEGQWAEKSGVKLPYTLGHENAGWVHEIGSAVTNVEVGDTVIVHPFISCGLCARCRAGDDMHCVHGSFPGINRDGGFADFLQTSARSVVKLDHRCNRGTSRPLPTQVSPRSTQAGAGAGSRGGRRSHDQGRRDAR
jgi:NAD+-dependent secondary alcohol dehydrogenase Adh1